MNGMNPDTKTVECVQCKNQIPVNVESCPYCNNPNKKRISNYSEIAQKIAGIILILNGIALAFEEILFDYGGSNVGNQVSNIVGTIIIGIMILSGSEKGLKWARIAVCLGAVVFPVIYIIQADMFMMAFQLIYSFILISLLFWNPGKVRVIISTSLAVLYFSVEVLGFYSEISGNNIIADLFIGLNYDIETLTDSKIQGRNYNYSLEIQDIKDWSAMSAKEIALNNEDADIWLMNPSSDAYIIVVAETLSIHLDSFADLITSNLKISFPGSIWSDSESIFTHTGIPGKQFDISADIDGDVFIYRYGLFTDEECAYQVICFSHEDYFNKVENDFSNIIKSFSIRPY
jgi:hypothetical protein